MFTKCCQTKCFEFFFNPMQKERKVLFLKCLQFICLLILFQKGENIWIEALKNSEYFYIKSFPWPVVRCRLSNSNPDSNETFLLQQHKLFVNRQYGKAENSISRNLYFHDTGRDYHSRATSNRSKFESGHQS